MHKNDDEPTIQPATPGKTTMHKTREDATIELTFPDDASTIRDNHARDETHELEAPSFHSLEEQTAPTLEESTSPVLDAPTPPTTTPSIPLPPPSRQQPAAVHRRVHQNTPQTPFSPTDLSSSASAHKPVGSPTHAPEPDDLDKTLPPGAHLAQSPKITFKPPVNLERDLPAYHPDQATGDYSTPGFIPSEAFKGMANTTQQSQPIHWTGRVKYGVIGTLAGATFGGILGILNMTLENLTVSQGIPYVVLFMFIMSAALGGFCAYMPELIEERLIALKILGPNDSLLHPVESEKSYGPATEEFAKLVMEYVSMAKEGLQQIKERFRK